MQKLNIYAIFKKFNIYAKVSLNKNFIFYYLFLFYVKTLLYKHAVISAFIHQLHMQKYTLEFCV